MASGTQRIDRRSRSRRSTPEAGGQRVPSRTAWAGGHRIGTRCARWCRPAARLSRGSRWHELARLLAHAYTDGAATTGSDGPPSASRPRPHTTLDGPSPASPLLTESRHPRTQGGHGGAERPTDRPPARLHGRHDRHTDVVLSRIGACTRRAGSGGSGESSSAAATNRAIGERMLWGAHLRTFRTPDAPASA